MAKNFKFELNSKGVRDLLQSGEMRGIIQTEVSAVQGRAAGMGGDYEASVITGQTRIVGRVAAADFRTRRKNLKENTLLKALGGS